MRLPHLTLTLGLLAGTLAAPVHTIDKRALPKLGGVNLAGCEFGIDTSGNAGSYYCPGTEQIGHFVSRGANLIRLPIGWQYLVGNKQASTTFDEAYFARYDNLVKASLAAGAYVMIDLHNYGRWNGGVIGAGGPSNQDFANLWSNLAKRYANQDRIIFGIMNEPHDQNMAKWAVTVQAAVDAIRAAGATSQSIALPGDFWAKAEKWFDGTNNPLVAITDPAGADKSKLIIDIHQYLNFDGSGQDKECVTNGVDKLSKLATWLKANNRRALVSEIGGGNSASCQKNLGEYLKFVATNDNFIGFAAWAAGSFDPNYVLSITPQNGQDNELFKKAIQPYFPGNLVVPSSAAPATPSSSSSSPAPPSVAPSTIRPSTSSVPPTTVRPSSSSAAPSVAPTTIRPSSSAPPTVAPTTVRPSSSAAPTVTPITVKPSSSAAPTTIAPSSSAAPTTFRSATPSTAAPTTAPTTVPTSSNASATSTARPSSASPTVTVTPPINGNLQKFAGTLGGACPAVLKSGIGYTSGPRTFNFLNDALAGSCYLQMDACQMAANKGGNKAPMTVEACTSQAQACLKMATA